MGVQLLELSALDPSPRPRPRLSSNRRLMRSCRFRSSWSGSLRPTTRHLPAEDCGNRLYEASLSIPRLLIKRGPIGGCIFLVYNLSSHTAPGFECVGWSWEPSGPLSSRNVSGPRSVHE